MYKDVFMNEHEQSLDIVEEWKNFIRKIKKLKPYMIEFKENSAINNKIYPFDYIVYNNDYCPIIIITHNKYIFSANDEIWKA